VALGAAVLVGCGGKSDTEKYIEKVNRAQDKHGARIASVARPGAGVGVYVAQARAITNLIGDLRKIKAPKGLGDEHSVLIAALAQAAAEVRTGKQIDFSVARVRTAITAINRGL
jgi:hypothetical protein